MSIDFKKLFEDVATHCINLKGKLDAVLVFLVEVVKQPMLILETMKNKFEKHVEPSLLANYVPIQKKLASLKKTGQKGIRKLDE